jgi:hypothetical protein
MSIQNKVRWNKKKKRRPAVWDEECPGSLIKRSGWATSAITNLLSEAIFTTTASGGGVALRMDLAPSIWQAVAFTAVQIKSAYHSIYTEWSLTNLNNIPLKLKLYMVEPKISGSNISAASAVYKLLDNVWTDNGQTTGTWNYYDFDIRDIPHVQSVAKVTLIGETQLEPQTETRVWKNSKRITRTYAENAAISTNSAGNGVANAHYWQAGEVWLWAFTQSPMISGSGGVGRAVATVYSRINSQYKFWMGNEQTVTAVQAVDAVYTGTGTVFSKTYATIADYKQGNTVLN